MRDRLVRVVQDPRTRGVLQAGPRTAAFLAHAWQRKPVDSGTVVPVPRTPLLAGQVLLDELLIAFFKHPDLVPSEDDFVVAEADIVAAHEMFADRGWLQEPSTYHLEPPPPDDAQIARARAFQLAYEHLTYTSGWEPHEGEPGRARWLDHQANRTAHTWVLPGKSSCWLIGVHGFGMGRPLTDIRGFRSRALSELGLSVALPVLPLHGPRSTGRTRGDGLMTIDLMDSLHGLAQAAWDIRRLVRWLRAERGAERIAVYGMSLGGAVVALLAALEADLDCVVAGIPVVDLPWLYRHHAPQQIEQWSARFPNALGTAAQEVHRVVSPLAMPVLTPHDRLFIFAGLGDRMSTFGQARRLWEHWGRPQMASYPGGHVGFFWSGAVQGFVLDALRTTGLVPRD